MTAALARLREMIVADGGLAAVDLRAVPRGDARSAALAASVATATERGHDLRLVVEAVREGHLLHHGRARLFQAADADLALLVGDRCYAYALELLAAVGDLEAITIISDLIALTATNAGDLTYLDGLWELSLSELDCGADERSRALKDRLRSGDSVDVGELIDAANALRERAARPQSAAGDTVQHAP